MNATTDKIGRGALYFTAVVCKETIEDLSKVIILMFYISHVMCKQKNTKLHTH